MKLDPFYFIVDSAEWIERLVPPPDGYEQLVAQKRVMFAAYAA